MRNIVLNLEEITAENSLDTYIRESVGVQDGEKYYTFTMLLTTVGVRSINGLVFTKEELEEMVGNIGVTRRLERGGVIGEMNHPQTEGAYYYEVDLNNGAYSINEFFFDTYKDKLGVTRTGLFGKCVTIPATSAGKTLAGYLALGYVPTCSMRGRFFKNPNSPTGRGVSLSCYDIVFSPSNVDSAVDMSTVSAKVYGGVKDVDMADAIMEGINNRNKIYNKIEKGMRGVNHVLDNNFSIGKNDIVCDMYANDKVSEMRIGESESINIDGIVKNDAGIIIGSVIREANVVKDRRDAIAEELMKLKRR